MTVARGGSNMPPTGTISEEEVKNVVARALEKKAQQSPDWAATAEETTAAPPEPSVDPELVRKKIQAATAQLLTRKAQPDNGAPPPDRRKMRRGVTFSMRFFGFMQQVFPLFLTVALFGVLVIVVKNSTPIHGFIDQNLKPDTSKTAPADPDDLIAQGKFEQARTLLEKRKKEGKLDSDGVSTLNSVYFRLAKKEGKARHYKTAVGLLELMTGEDREDEEVRALLKKYKRAGNIR